MTNQHIANKGAAIHFAQSAAAHWQNGIIPIEAVYAQAMLSIANSLIAITTLLEPPEDDIAIKETNEHANPE